MSTSNEWDEWHLTPNGWVEGSTRTDGNHSSDKSVERPTDAVLSRRYMEWYSGPRQKFAVVPLHRGNDEAEIERLLSKYGQHPNESCASIARRA